MTTYDLFLFAGQSNMAGRGIACTQFPEGAPDLISGAGAEFKIQVFQFSACHQAKAALSSQTGRITMTILQIQ